MVRTLALLAARNTGRSRARSGLTVGMVVAGVALLMVALTWVNGIFSEMTENAAAQGGHVRIVSPEYAAREELMPLWANLPQAETLAGRIATLPGVVAVEPRLLTGVTVTVGQEIGEVFALAVGGSERFFRERLKAREHLVRGGWFTGAPDEIVMGARVAEAAGAAIGDEAVLVGTTQDGALSPVKGRLVGIVRTGTLLDQQVLLPLEKLQYLADIPGGATELLVFGADYRAGPALARQLRAAGWLKDLKVQAWDEREPLASLTRTGRFVQTLIGLVVVLLAALGIWNTMTTAVLERTHEIGVLRAMGMTRLGAVALFVGEALAIGVAGGMAGLGLGLGPCLLLQERGIRIGEAVTGRLALPLSEVMHGRLSLGIAAGAFGLGLAMAVVGSLPAALRAASIQPVSAMRSGR